MEGRLALPRHADWSAEHPPEAVEPDQPRPAPRHHPGVAAEVWTETDLKRRKISKEMMLMVPYSCGSLNFSIKHHERMRTDSGPSLVP